MQVLRDLVSFIVPLVALAPTSISAAGNTDGVLIDRDSAQSHTFILNATITDGTATLQILEGDADDGSDLTVATDVVTDDASLAASGTVMVGYIGAKKYLKARVVVTDEGTLAVVAAVTAIQASNHIVGGT